MANTSFGNLFRATALSAVTIMGGMATVVPAAHAGDPVMEAQKKLDALRAHTKATRLETQKIREETAAKKRELAANNQEIAALDQEVASIDKENGCRDTVMSAKKSNQIDMAAANKILAGAKPSAFGWCNLSAALKL